MIHWPALIKFSGDAELLYIGTRGEWDKDPDLHAVVYEEADRLIDSAGTMYRLPYNEDTSCVEIAESGEQLSVDALCSLLKEHFLCLRQCCVPKFHISSHGEGMKMLEQ